MTFEFADDAAVAIRRVGEENEPVVVIDGVLQDPIALADKACELRFAPIGPYYPGVRAPVSADCAASALVALTSILRDQLGVTAPNWSIEGYFSIVTTPPDRLAPIQRFPHYDGVEDQRFAALLFLCDAKFGGTAFYRHVSTGFETVNAGRFPRFKQALEEDVRKGGLPSAAYIGDGAPYFERIAEFEAAPNRMLIYRGKALHCSAIRAPEQLSSDPRTGRLTVNFFLSPRNSP